MVHNPFELDKLTKINNIDMTFDDKVFHDLAKITDVGQQQFNYFVKASVSLDDPIKKNSFLTPGNFEEQKKEKSKKLIYSTDKYKNILAGTYDTDVLMLLLKSLDK